MGKNLIVVLVVLVVLLFVLIVLGGIAVNKYKPVTPTATGSQKLKASVADVYQGTAPSLKTEPIHFDSSKKKKKEGPVEEIEILPPGQKPGVLVN